MREREQNYQFRTRCPEGCGFTRTAFPYEDGRHPTYRTHVRFSLEPCAALAVSPFRTKTGDDPSFASTQLSKIDDLSYFLLLNRIAFPYRDGRQSEIERQKDMTIIACASSPFVLPFRT